VKISTLIWKARFMEKIRQRHKVSMIEVEQALSARPRIQFAERGDVAGENLYRALGRTDAGRYLAVFFIDKGKGRALPISARDMTPKERKSYGTR
jgi:uncharacterized DUF497 family protein